MKVTFLGTGTSQGVPVIACSCRVCRSKSPRDQRLRCSVLLEFGDGITVVIDTGPDFRQQMLREEVVRLDAVLFTHKHKDHVAGLDDIRSYNFKQGSSMPIYADGLTIRGLKQEFSYIFDGTDYPGIPRVSLHEIQDDPFEVKGHIFLPIPVMHHLMPVKAFRIGSFGYVTDANWIPEHSKERLRGLEVLVLNALRKEKHISHFNLSEAIALAQELGAQQTYFTHISHLLGLHDEVSEELPKGIYLAYDGLKLELGG